MRAFNFFPIHHWIANLFLPPSPAGLALLWLYESMQDDACFLLGVSSRCKRNASIAIPEEGVLGLDGEVGDRGKVDRRVLREAVIV